MRSSIGRDTPYSFVSCQPPSLLPPLMYACNNFRRSLPTHQGAHARILRHTRFSSHVTLLESLLVWFVDVGSGSITIQLCHSQSHEASLRGPGQSRAALSITGISKFIFVSTPTSHVFYILCLSLVPLVAGISALREA